MFIVPLTEIQPLFPTEAEKPKSSGSGFDGILKNAINELETAQAVSDKDSLDLAMGRTDDLHTIQINAMKNAAMIELTSAVTSKVLTSYQNIMNIQV